MLNNSEKSSPISLPLRFLYLLEWEEDIEAVAPLSNRTAAGYPACFSPRQLLPAVMRSLFPFPTCAAHTEWLTSIPWSGGAEGEGFSHEWIERTEAKGFRTIIKLAAHPVCIYLPT